jgi:glycosyltransferase involved in cell wall biosynthesis
VNVIHVHGYKATVIAALAARTCPGLRIVKSEHGGLEPPSQCRGYPRCLRLVLNVALDCMATRTTVDRRVCISDEIRTRRERWCGPGLVIHNGIERPSGPPPARRPASGDFVVGIVGRLTAVKGHQYLFRAMTRLRPSVRVRVFGTGPDEERLRSLARELGVHDRVEFDGFVAPIQPEIAGLDLLAMASLHEGLPYTLLEAMSLGVPVVASAVGGILDVIDDGVSARLVPQRDPQVLAEAIDGIERDPAAARTMAANALQRVATDFDASRMVDAYLEVFAGLLDAEGLPNGFSTRSVRG